MKGADTEQTEITAQGVQTQVTEGAAEEISLGKFKDVKSLLSAYNSLEAEFTKRCQRIKELEGAAVTDKAEEKNNVPEYRAGETGVEKEEILKDYLKGILKGKQAAIVMSDAGVGVKAPADKPKTIAAAGMLAKEYFKK